MSEDLFGKLGIFLEENNIELSLQSDRDFTDMKKISSYVLKLEGAVRFYSGKSLDTALGDYLRMRGKNDYFL
jgi:hypothetical protein